MKSRALLLGIGNTLRRDDGVGIAVAKAIESRKLPGVDVVAIGGEELNLMELWHGYEQVFLVDAIQSGALPGTLHSFDATREEVPFTVFGRSTHSMSLAESVELARALGSLPSHLNLYGVEGVDFELGEGLTAEVSSGVSALVERIAADIGRRVDA